ncbi:hypothetical protein Pelo_16238 [Pelomyxa schiedti]|nr:hypothetical protein Pelo_16238 [Pelomyxa schiedti]
MPGTGVKTRALFVVIVCSSACSVIWLLYHGPGWVTAPAVPTALPTTLAVAVAPPPPIIGVGKHPREAFVFVLTNDSPLVGILTVNQGLVNTKTERQRVALCTPGVTDACKKVLQMANISIIDLEWPNTNHSNWKPRFPQWDTTLTKVELWRLGDKFDRIIYLDADLHIAHNIDEMFDMKEPIVASAYFIKCNDNAKGLLSGVMSTVPNETWYQGMMEVLDTTIITDGDQQMIEHFLARHKIRPVLPSHSYIGKACHCACWKNKPYPYNLSDVKVVHFTHQFMLDYRAAAEAKDGQLWGWCTCAPMHYRAWKNTFLSVTESLRSYLMQYPVSGNLLVYIAAHVPAVVDEEILQQQRHLRNDLNWFL